MREAAMPEAPSFAAPAAADPRDGEVYVTSPELDLAVDVALATGRPLLLRGHPGSHWKVPAMGTTRKAATRASTSAGSPPVASPTRSAARGLGGPSTSMG